MDLLSIKSPRRTVEQICHDWENSLIIQDIAYKNGAFWTYHRKLSPCKTPSSVAQRAWRIQKIFLKSSGMQVIVEKRQRF